MEVRSEVVHEADGWVRGVRYQRASPDHEWSLVPNSEWARLTVLPWIAGSPVEMLRALGIETTARRAVDFANACDTNVNAFYYLSAATPPGTGDESLKWIMGALAAELNARQFDMRHLSILPADYLRAFVRDLVSGRLDRSVSKAVFAELLVVPRFTVDDEGNTVRISGEEVMTRLMADPRFQAADASAIDAMIDTVIADNPEQVEKAKENPKLVQWLVGQVMKAAKGKAPAATVLEKVTERLAR